MVPPRARFLDAAGAPSDRDCDGAGEAARPRFCRPLAAKPSALAVAFAFTIAARCTDTPETPQQTRFRKHLPDDIRLDRTHV